MKSIMAANQGQLIIGVAIAEIGIGVIAVVDFEGTHWIVAEDRCAPFRPVTLAEREMVLEAIRYANAHFGECRDDAPRTQQ